MSISFKKTESYGAQNKIKFSSVGAGGGSLKLSTRQVVEPAPEGGWGKPVGYVGAAPKFNLVVGGYAISGATFAENPALSAVVGHQVFAIDVSDKVFTDPCMFAITCSAATKAKITAYLYADPTSPYVIEDQSEGIAAVFYNTTVKYGAEGSVSDVDVVMFNLEAGSSDQVTLAVLFKSMVS